MKRLLALAPVATAIATVLAFAVPAHAAITVYTDQASFLAAVQGQATDSFDDLTPSDPSALPLSLPRSVGAYGYTVGAAGNLYITANPDMNADRWVSIFESSDDIVINGFTGGVAAAGMFLFSINSLLAVIPADVTATVTDSLGASLVWSPAPSSAGNFVGFVSTGLLTSVTVNSSFGGGAPFVTINNLTLAAPIPEPGTWALLLAGLGVVGSLARRRLA
jgi:hypothetical protein